MSHTTATGIVERISQALTITQVHALLAEATGYKFASNRTLNRCRIRAEKRIAYLNGRKSK